MTAFERIKEIEYWLREFSGRSEIIGTLNSQRRWEYLLKAFNVMREIAIDSYRDTSTAYIPVPRKIYEKEVTDEFEERMK